MDLEGIVLEYIFDSQSRPVLHGCWAATAFGAEPRRRITPTSSCNTSVRSSSGSKSSTHIVPKIYPVVAVGPEEDLGDTEQDPDVEECPHGLSSLQREMEAEWKDVSPRLQS